MIFNWFILSTFWFWFVVGVIYSVLLDGHFSIFIFLFFGLVRKIFLKL